MHGASTLLALACAVIQARPAAAQADVAEPAGSSPAAVEALLSMLGDPPRPEVVTSLVRIAGEGDVETAGRIVALFTSLGGHAAARGLFDLARHRDASVRFAALQGIAEVGLRLADGADSVRLALLDAKPDVRTAAFVALARVGDASDLPALLGALGSDDVRTHAAADRALSELTGISLQEGNLALWSEWWRGARIVLPGRLEAALRRIENGGDPADLREAREFLAANAWFDVGRVEEVVSGWLHSADARRRVEGYRAAARCRLGDLADDVRRAAREELDADVIVLALCSAKVLGVEVEGLTLPPKVLDVVAMLGDDGEASAAELATGEEAQLLSEERRQLEEERRAAAAKHKAGRSFAGGGGLGGPAVWLDLDGKGARAREGGTRLGDFMEGLLAGSNSSWRSFAMVGFPLLGVTVALAVALAMRRRRKEFDAMERWASDEAARTGALAAPAPPFEPPLAEELREIGLHPEGLSAAGVRAREVSVVMIRGSQWYTTNQAPLDALKSKCFVARALRERLKGLVEFRMASVDEEARWHQAVDACNAVQPKLAAIRDSFFDMATSSLSTEARATLLRIRAHQEGRTLPVHFLVVERSEAEWRRLEEVLALEADAKRRHVELNSKLEGWLMGLRSDPAVRQARLNLNETLGDVAREWRRAVARIAAVDEASIPWLAAVGE